MDEQQQSPKKSRLWIILTVVVVLILAGGGVLLFILISAAKSPIYMSYGERALEENNLSICLELNGKPHTYPMDCWKYVASLNGNINLCSQISSELEMYNCYTGFIDIRWQFNKQALCEELASSKDKNYCYMVTGVSSKDASFCDKISNPETQTQVADCYRNVADAS